MVWARASVALPAVGHEVAADILYPLGSLSVGPDSTAFTGREMLLVGSLFNLSTKRDHRRQNQKGRLTQASEKQFSKVQLHRGCPLLSRLTCPCPFSVKTQMKLKDTIPPPLEWTTLPK